MSDKFRLDSYFARIGFRGPAGPDAATLAALHACHAILPFLFVGNRLGFGQEETKMFDLVIKNAEILDGSGAKSSQYEYSVRVCATGPLCLNPPPCAGPKTLFFCALGQDADVTCQ